MVTPKELHILNCLCWRDKPLAMQQPDGGEDIGCLMLRESMEKSMPKANSCGIFDCDKPRVVGNEWCMEHAPKKSCSHTLSLTTCAMCYGELLEFRDKLIADRDAMLDDIHAAWLALADADSGSDEANRLLIKWVRVYEP